MELLLLLPGFRSTLALRRRPLAALSCLPHLLPVKETNRFLESPATQLKSDQPECRARLIHGCGKISQCQRSLHWVFFLMCRKQLLLVLITRHGPHGYVRRPQINRLLFKHSWLHPVFSFDDDKWRKCLNAGTKDPAVVGTRRPGSCRRADRRATEEVCPPPGTTCAHPRARAAVPAPTTPCATASVGQRSDCSADVPVAHQRLWSN